MTNISYIDKFRVISLIGQGGMASVYLAEEPNTRQKVAIKLMDPEATDDKIRRIRFNAESKAIIRLQHPNIIKILQPTKKVKVNVNGRSVLTLYYVMEYFPGKSLKHFISEIKIPFEQIIDLFIQILDALSYCHKAKIYHRDLKPANILVKKKESKLHAVITDFGIAKFKGDELSKGVELTTAAIKALGAPAYMAPEQIEDPRKVSDRSDLYSVGIMLYEALTGQRPFRGTYSELIQQQLMKTPVPPKKLNPDVDDTLNKLVMKLLEKDPRKRPANAQEVIAALQSFVGLPEITVNTQHQTFHQTLHKTSTTIYSSSGSSGPFVKKISEVIIRSNKGQMIFTSFPIIIGKFSNHGNNFFPIYSKSPKVSHKHVVILKKDSKYILKNLSPIGVKVNNELVKKSMEIHENKKYNLLFPDGSKINLAIKIKEITNVLPLVVIVFILLFIIVILLMNV